MKISRSARLQTIASLVFSCLSLSPSYTFSDLFLTLFRDITTFPLLFPSTYRHINNLSDTFVVSLSSKSQYQGTYTLYRNHRSSSVFLSFHYHHSRIRDEAILACGKTISPNCNISSLIRRTINFPRLLLIRADYPRKRAAFAAIINFIVTIADKCSP